MHLRIQVIVVAVKEAMVNVRTHIDTCMPSPVTHLPFIFPLVWTDSSSL